MCFLRSGIIPVQHFIIKRIDDSLFCSSELPDQPIDIFLVHSTAGQMIDADGAGDHIPFGYQRKSMIREILVCVQLFLRIRQNFSLIV